MLMLENIEGLQQAVSEGRAIFGNIDSWLIWNLTGGPDGGKHITEVTNASRTMLMNLNILDWDNELCEIMPFNYLDNLPYAPQHLSPFHSLSFIAHKKFCEIYNINP